MFRKYGGLDILQPYGSALPHTDADLLFYLLPQEYYFRKGLNLGDSHCNGELL
jgi:hypothetical protein